MNNDRRTFSISCPVKQNVLKLDFLFFSFPLTVVLFSNCSAEFMGNSLRGYLYPCKVLEKKDYGRKNVFAVS